MTKRTEQKIVDQPRLFIDGMWRPPLGGELINVISPATEEVIGRVGNASVDDINIAVAAARRSFDEGNWRNSSVTSRADILDRAADILESRIPELATILTSELGCIHGFSLATHVPGPIRHLRYYADLIRNSDDTDRRSDGSNISEVIREPVGVVGAISPWNGPLSGIILKAAPAIAAGCSVVAKPSPEAPLSGIALADALHEAGLPRGVFNLVPGDGVAGEALVTHPDVDKIGFTGSTAVGKRIMQLASQRVARVTLELGGKSAAIILDDADIDEVAQLLPPMLLSVNGQICIAQSRVLVPRARSKQIIDALSASMAQAIVGDPFDSKTVVGPLVSARQRERVEGYIALAKAEGARLTCGGNRPTDMERGFYIQPTVLADVNNAMRIAQEEIFGPVMAIIEYDDVDDAVRIANDSIYGLSGSVWSTDVPRAVAVARRLRTGMVSINGARQAWGTPFGGFKQSGTGREMGPEGIQAYIELKSIALPAAHFLGG